MLFLYFFVLTAGVEPALTDDVLHPFYFLPEISTLVQLMLSRGAGMPFPRHINKFNNIKYETIN